MIVLNNIKIPAPPATIIRLTQGMFRLDDPAYGQPIDLELPDPENELSVEALTAFFDLVDTGTIKIRGAVIGELSKTPLEKIEFKGQSIIFTGELAFYHHGNKLPDDTEIVYFDMGITFARKYMLFADPHIECLRMFGEQCQQAFKKHPNAVVHAGYFDTFLSGRAITSTSASEFDPTHLIPKLFTKFINGEV